MSLTSFRGGPLFAALHEAIYADGEARTDWSAERLRAEFPEFGSARRPLLFTGEMIYPWMFDEISALRPFKPGVDALARRQRHSRLYDPARLAGNDAGGGGDLP
jgi:proline iminopeptidase